MNELANLIDSRSVDKEICKLPHNLEAEQMLIGAMIRDNRICDAVEDMITADNFFLTF
jgi:replicative DNA helicase